MARQSAFVTSVREIFSIITIGILLLFTLEIIVRFFFPHETLIRGKNGMTLGKLDNILGHRNQPSARVTVTSPEYSTEYVVNEEGMRDEAQHPVPKPANVCRILLLGDSFTWGTGVDYIKTWPVIFEQAVEKQLHNIEVVKAGVSGYDTRQEVVYLGQLMPEYSPDVVVIAFLPNDLVTNMPISSSDSVTAMEIRRQDSLVTRSQQDKSSGLQVATLAKRLLISNDYLYSKLYLMTERATYFTTPEPEKLLHQIAITESLFTTAAKYCRSQNVHLIVLSVPQLFQVIVKARHQHPDNVDVELVDKEFSRFAELQQFLWIKTLPVLSDEYAKREQDLYFRFDGHLNEEGHRLLGEYFAQQVIKQLTTRYSQ